MRRRIQRDPQLPGMAPLCILSSPVRILSGSQAYAAVGSMPCHAGHSDESRVHPGWKESARNAGFPGRLLELRISCYDTIFAQADEGGHNIWYLALTSPEKGGTISPSLAGEQVSVHRMGTCCFFDAGRRRADADASRRAGKFRNQIQGENGCFR